MRSRRPAPEEVADVARRRLALLSAELAEIRPEGLEARSRDDGDGSGGLAASSDASDEGDSAWAIDRVTDPAVRQPRDSAADRSLQRAPDRAPGRHAHRSVGLGASMARWVEDRLPPSLQGRVRLSASHLAVVALTVAVGLALTVWWVARADGDVTTIDSVPSAAPATSGSASPGLVATSGSAAGATPESPSAPSGSGAASGPPGAAVVPGMAGASPAVGGAPAPSTGSSVASSIVVDVTGKVHRPGIATLPNGSRVVDAIEAAGGAKHGARLATLNLARVLVDGEQVVVGVPAPAGVAASAAAAPTSGTAIALVPVNTATEVQLEELPGVGPVTAQAILDYRTQNGAFTSVDQLLEVSGIGDAILTP